MFFVADMNMHDIEGAFLLFALKALLNRNIPSLLNPLEKMRLISQMFIPHLRPGESFSACLALLDRSQSKLLVVNAGPLPFLYHKKGDGVVLLGGKSDVIGLNRVPNLEQIEQKVQAGDRFYLFTDGLIEPLDEAEKPKEEILQELMQCCLDAECLPIDMAPSEITNTFKLAAPAPQDDILLIGVEV
jgi:serine phosphatase RsbU (regulator of sigma subunit)